MNLVFEPPDRDKFLRCLNECFPGWGEGPMYDWSFARRASAPPPERMVFTDAAGEWIAGTAISYRVLRAVGRRWLGGVMTGSWTLASARGKGLFPRFIQETRVRVAYHGGVAVLGFAGDLERASTRKLAQAGSRCVPSFHGIGEIMTDFAAPLDVDVRPVAEADLGELYDRWKQRAERAGGFAYDDLGAFAGQFVRRALPTEVARTDGDALAILEVAKDTDRVLFLDAGAASATEVLRSLHARASSARRKLFAFAVGEEDARPLLAAGLAPKPGYFTILPATDSVADAAICDALAGTRWDFQAGDRI